MDNTQMPPVQQPNTAYAPSAAPSGQVAAAAIMAKKNKTNDLVKTLFIVILSLVSLTFIGLFVWILMQYNEVSADVESQIDAAVAEAKEAQALELEEKFAEREKYPYRVFSGPADYGELTFEYPKTWSVYIASDASTGGDFSAYLNPIEVNMVSKNTINALRVTIRDKDFESVAAEYQRAIDKKDSGLSVQTTTVAGTVANRYTGTIPNTELNGIIVIFKIRDKTAVLQTDSMIFENDFDQLLETVEFNA